MEVAFTHLSKLRPKDGSVLHNITWLVSGWIESKFPDSKSNICLQSQSSTKRDCGVFSGLPKCDKSVGLWDPRKHFWEWCSSSSQCLIMGMAFYSLEERRQGWKGIIGPRCVLLAWASVHALSPLELWQKSGHRWEHISRLPASFFHRAMGPLNGIGCSLSCLIARWQISEIREKRHYEELPFCPCDCSQGFPFQLWMFQMKSWGARKHAGSICQHCIAWPSHPHLRVGIGPTTSLWVLQWSEPGQVHVPPWLGDVCIASDPGQWLDFFHPPQWLCSC